MLNKDFFEKHYSTLNYKIKKINLRKLCFCFRWWVFNLFKKNQGINFTFNVFKNGDVR